MAQYMTQGGYITSSLGRAKTRARKEAKEYGRSYVENTDSGKTVYRVNPAGGTGKKKSLPASLVGFLKHQNPGKMRGVSQVRVKRLRGGGVTITPVKKKR